MAETTGENGGAKAPAAPNTGTKRVHKEAPAGSSADTIIRAQAIRERQKQELRAALADKVVKRGQETSNETPTPEFRRDDRETVVNAFNSSFSLLEQVPEDQLSQEEIWTKQAIKAAKEKTIDQGKDKFTNSFADFENARTYTQEEGVPIEGLLEFLRKRAEPLAPDSDEKKELIRLAHVLYRNSQPFTRLPDRMESAQLLGRVRQEAYFVSKDVRATGSDFDNWLKAKRTLMGRIELTLPPTQVEAASSTLAAPAVVDAEAPTEAAAEVAPPAVSAAEAAAGPTEEVAPPVAEPETPAKVAPVVTGLPPEVIEPGSIQERRYNISVINATEGASKYAQLEARKDVTASLKKGHWWQVWDWPRKIGLRLIEPAAVLSRKTRLYQAMVKNNTSFLTMPEVKNSASLTQRQAEAKKQEEAVVKRFKEGGIRSGEKVETAKGELRIMLLNEILKPITKGQLTTRDQVRERLAQFVKDHLNDPQVEVLFGASANDFGDTAELFATDVLETGLKIKVDMETHNETLEQIDKYIDIRLGYAKLGHMTESRDVVDRAVAWANRRRSQILATGAKGLGYRGIILNPLVIGVGASIATTGIMRTAGFAGQAAQIPSLFVGGGAGALVAGARRYYELGVYDRPQHMIEQALGGEKPTRGAPRRASLEHFRYNMTTVDELINGGGTELVSGIERMSRTDLLALNLAEGDPQQRLRNIEALARRRAEIQTRLDLSVELRKDLIGYKSKLEADVSPTDLTEDAALYGARINEYYRQQFKNAGVSDQEIERRAQEELDGLDMRFKGDWKKELISNIEEQDRDFQGYRLRNALGAAVFGGAAGFAGGVAFQEGFAQIARHFPEAANIPVIGGLFQKGETLREQLMRERGLKTPGILQAPAAPPTPSAGTLIETIETTNVLSGPKTGVEVNDITGHRTSIPKGTEWVRDPLDPNKWDLRVLGKPDKILINDARFDSSGKLVDWDHTTSQDSLFKVENPPQGTEIIRGAQAVSEWEKLNTPVHHREWYAYDKPGSQGNELRLYTAKDGDAVTLDMSKMEQGFQRGLTPNPIDVQEVIKTQKSGFMFSIPGPDGKLISAWVPDGADGAWDGKLRLDPNDTTHFVEFNGKKMPLGEFSKMVLNQNALNPLSNGDIATELYKRQDVFKLGAGGKMGFIEAGTLVDRPEGKVLQAFATIRGNGGVQVELPKGFVAEVTLKGSWVEEIKKLVPAPEAPQPQPIEVEGEAPPIIPIPLAPRHPLEPLAPTEKAKRTEEGAIKPPAPEDREPQVSNERVEAAIPTLPRGLVEEMKKTLAESSSETARFEASPTTLIDYVKTIKLPAGASIKESSAQIQNGQLTTSGVIETAFGDAKFTATLVNNPAGGVKVTDKEIDLPFLAKVFREQIEEYIENLNEVIIGQVNKQIDPAWEAVNFRIGEDKVIFEFRKKEIAPSTQPQPTGPPPPPPVVEPFEATAQVAQKDLEKETFRARIVEEKKRFEQLNGAPGIVVSPLYTTLPHMLWQEVSYDPPRTKNRDSCFRGYLMVEPEDMETALSILRYWGRERKIVGKRTDFKWLLASSDAVKSKPDDINVYGRYEKLKPTDGRIVIYGDTPNEIQEILASLVTFPKWQDIEQRRVAKYGGRPKNAPRRPGTNSFVDKNGKEWRTLNYNDKPGYSENEAADPDWRARKKGVGTQLASPAARPAGPTPSPAETLEATAETEQKLASTIKELPPLKEGFVRLVHLTNPRRIEEIIKTGLRYKGSVDSTARAFGTRDSIEYSSGDPRFNYPGIKAVILDVPADLYRLYINLFSPNNPELIPPEYIIGVVDAYNPTTDPRRRAPSSSPAAPPTGPTPSPAETLEAQTTVEPAPPAPPAEPPTGPLLTEKELEALKHAREELEKMGAPTSTAGAPILTPEEIDALLASLPFDEGPLTELTPLAAQPAGPTPPPTETLEADIATSGDSWERLKTTFRFNEALWDNAKNIREVVSQSEVIKQGLPVYYPGSGFDVSYALGFTDAEKFVFTDFLYVDKDGNLVPDKLPDREIEKIGGKIISTTTEGILGQGGKRVVNFGWGGKERTLVMYAEDASKFVPEELKDGASFIIVKSPTPASRTERIEDQPGHLSSPKPIANLLQTLAVDGFIHWDPALYRLVQPETFGLETRIPPQPPVKIADGLTSYYENGYPLYQKLREEPQTFELIKLDEALGYALSIQEGAAPLKIDQGTLIYFEENLKELRFYYDQLRPEKKAEIKPILKAHLLPAQLPDKRKIRMQRFGKDYGLDNESKLQEYLTQGIEVVLRIFPELGEPPAEPTVARPAVPPPAPPPAPEAPQPRPVEVEVDQALSKSDELRAARDELAGLQQGLVVARRSGIEPGPEQMAKLEQLQAEAERLQQESATPAPPPEPAQPPQPQPPAETLEAQAAAEPTPAEGSEPEAPALPDYVEEAGEKLGLTAEEKRALADTLKTDYFKSPIFEVGNTHIERDRLEEILERVIYRWDSLQLFSEREGNKRRLSKIDKDELKNIQEAVRELMPKKPKEPKEKDSFRKRLSWQLLFALDPNEHLSQYSAGEVQALIRAIEIMETAQSLKNEGQKTATASAQPSPPPAAEAEAPAEVPPAGATAAAPAPAGPPAQTETLEAAAGAPGLGDIKDGLREAIEGLKDLTASMRAPKVALSEETIQSLKGWVKTALEEQDSKKRAGVVGLLSNMLTADTSKLPQPTNAEDAKFLIVQELRLLAQNEATRESIRTLLEANENLRAALESLAKNYPEAEREPGIKARQLRTKLNALLVLKIIGAEPKGSQTAEPPTDQPPLSPVIEPLEDGVTTSPAEILEAAEADARDPLRPLTQEEIDELLANLPADEEAEKDTVAEPATPAPSAEPPAKPADQGLPESDQLAAAKGAVARFQQYLEGTLRFDEELTPEQKAELERLGAEVKRLEQKIAPPTEAPALPDYVERAGRELGLTTAEEKRALADKLKTDYFENPKFNEIAKQQLEKILGKVIYLWNDIRDVPKEGVRENSLGRDDQKKLKGIRERVINITPKLSFQLLMALDKDISQYSQQEVSAFLRAIGIMERTQSQKGKVNE